MFNNAIDEIIFDLGKISGLVIDADYQKEIQILIDSICENLVKIMADKINATAEKIITPEVTYGTKI